uniref:Biotin carboxylation domain-containing protein n=1 Tax=Chloropicon laureae TaxID=464258 RepID=A0A7S2YU63_9CHLO|mmetsp:Transcript_1023/g.2643  ORF Transcript_1023/g.2643 Transcript_1023/m.2643 type:complete len:103 (+) Transcript_1023:212-520(+)
MDSHVYPGYLVPPNYDSLLGKLIVWAPDREQAITRMERALGDTVISGVPTTIDYHKLILDHPQFKSGNVDTGFIPKYQEDLREPPTRAAEPRKTIVERVKVR